MIKQGEESCTTNVCYSKILEARGNKPLTKWQRYAVVRVQAKATEGAFDRKQEAFEKVPKDEARKLSTMQEVMLRSTGHLRRIVARRKSTPTGGVRSVEKTMIGGAKQAAGGATRRKCQPG